MPARARLKKGDISIQEIWEMSQFYYKSHFGDDKRKRVKLDVLSAVITARKNFQYNRSTRQWEQTGREVLFTFRVRTKPVSYKKTDKLAIHTYPVYFLLKDIGAGMNSAFRWREGSMARPVFPRVGMDKKQRDLIQIRNLRAGIQFDFFFKNMQLCDSYGLLYAVNTTNRRMPVKANKQMIPYFGKHALAVLERILIPLITREEGKRALQERNLMPKITNPSSPPLTTAEEEAVSDES